MTKRKIERVTFNIKTGDGSTRSYQMSGKNLIVGPNGSGKSAVQQAVALALTGAVDNLSGRPVVSDPKMIAAWATEAEPTSGRFSPRSNSTRENAVGGT